jgi:hypothetical protein
VKLEELSEQEERIFRRKKKKELETSPKMCVLH